MASLLFTAVVTPVEVAFLSTSVDPLFVINRLIDAVFTIVREGAGKRTPTPFA